MIKQQKAPFEGTKVPVPTSQAAISAMLDKYGIKDYQWTKREESYELSMIVETEIDAQVRRIGLRFNPPARLVKRRVWDEKASQTVVKNFADYAQTMRLLWHYLRIKLAVVSWGFKSFEEEFLSELIVRDRNGKESRLMDLVKPTLLALPEKVE